MIKCLASLVFEASTSNKSTIILLENFIIRTLESADRKATYGDGELLNPGLEDHICPSPRPGPYHHSLA